MFPHYLLKTWMSSSIAHFVWSPFHNYSEESRTNSVHRDMCWKYIYIYSVFCRWDYLKVLCSQRHFVTQEKSHIKKFESHFYRTLETKESHISQIKYCGFNKAVFSSFLWLTRINVGIVHFWKPQIYNICTLLCSRYIETKMLGLKWETILAFAATITARNAANVTLKRCQFWWHLHDRKCLPCVTKINRCWWPYNGWKCCRSLKKQPILLSVGLKRQSAAWQPSHLGVTPSRPAVRGVKGHRWLQPMGKGGPWKGPRSWGQVQQFTDLQ